MRFPTVGRINMQEKKPAAFPPGLRIRLERQRGRWSTQNLATKQVANGTSNMVSFLDFDSVLHHLCMCDIWVYVCDELLLQQLDKQALELDLWQEQDWCPFFDHDQLADKLQSMDARRKLLNCFTVCWEFFLLLLAVSRLLCIESLEIPMLNDGGETRRSPLPLSLGFWLTASLRMDYCVYYWILFFLFFFWVSVLELL